MGDMVARLASMVETGEEVMEFASGQGTPLTGAVTFTELLEQFRAQEWAPLFANDVELKQFVGRQGQELLGRLLTLANVVLLQLEALLVAEPKKFREIVQAAEVVGRYLALLQKHVPPRPVDASVQTTDDLSQRLERARARIAQAREGDGLPARPAEEV